MRKDTALLVIDMQNGFLSESSPLYIDGAPETIPACAKVIDHCRQQDVPVFFVTRIYYADDSNVEHTRFEAWLNGGKPLSPDARKKSPRIRRKSSAVIPATIISSNPATRRFLQRSLT